MILMPMPLIAPTLVSHPLALPSGSFTIGQVCDEI
jgi:hypothetical protein